MGKGEGTRKKEEKGEKGREREGEGRRWLMGGVVVA